ncbi:MAG: CoA-binding protein [Halobacteriales archaeon]
MPVETDDELASILDRSRIAVVGASTSEGKAAHDVPKYLQDQGYEVVPVNPFAEEVLGETAYDTIEDVPGTVDVVDVFRASDEALDILEAVLERDDDPVFWLQLGIENDEAMERAAEAGLTAVQDRCMKVEHERLVA